MDRSPGWNRKESFSAILCALSLAAVFSCGRRDPAPTTITPPPEPEKAVLNTAVEVEMTAAIVPPHPSRALPPRVVVASKSVEIRAPQQIRWEVNGSVVSEEERLSASLFRKGDAIRAVATMKTGERTIHLATPEVVAVRSLPSITEVRLEPGMARRNDTVHAVVKADNPDGEALSYRYKWFIDDVQVPGEGPSLHLAGVSKVAWVHVQVVSNDGISDGGWRYSPKYKVENSPPVITSGPATVIAPDGLFTHTIVAEDPDGDVLSYTLKGGPPGMTMTGATLRWNVPVEAYGTNVLVTVNISDNDGGVISHTLSMTPRKN
jgi:hypothetical protein